MASAAMSQYAVNAIPQAKKQTKSFYTVKQGDTWWNIAKAHQVSIDSLAKWNNKTSNDVLQPGQKLVMLSSSQPSQSRKSVNYTIKNGDSLWAISRKFNVSVAQVREWNGLNTRSTLQPGQSLTLYLDET
jgi:membrane-bound lytic murein transglycosylase D